MRKQLLTVFTGFKHLIVKSNSLLKVSGKTLMIVFVLFILTFSGCEKEDLGKCTIKISGGNKVIEDISIEECQLEFGETVGAYGWSWEPNN